MELYTVYINTRKLLQYRGYTLDENQPLDESTFSNLINRNDFYKLSSKGKEIQNLTIIFNYNSKHLIKPEILRKFLVKLLKDHHKVNSLVLIKSPEHSIYSIDTEQWSTFMTKQLKKIGDDIYVERSDYSRLIICLPEHILYQKHEIITEKQLEEEYLDFNTLSKNQLPELAKDDAAVFWIGARPGDIVKIHRFTETGGLIYVYKIVKDAYAYTVKK